MFTSRCEQQEATSRAEDEQKHPALLDFELMCWLAREADAPLTRLADFMDKMIEHPVLADCCGIAEMPKCVGGLARLTVAHLGDASKFCRRMHCTFLNLLDDLVVKVKMEEEDDRDFAEMERL